MHDLALRAAVWIQTTAPGTTPAPGSGTGTVGDTIDEQSITQKITDSGLWKNIIGPLSVGLAIVVVLFGAYKIITQVASGKTPGAMKTAITTLLVAGLLFRLDLLFVLIDTAGKVIASVVEAITGLIG